MRVYCLYRVSTKKQVDHNWNAEGEKEDIPMQRIECQNFCNQMGWTIEKEFYEKGISGSKVSADDRDAIQDLREAAEKKEFDVLLVYMFDRIGRIDDETPFVVEWFVQQGVRVWSVKEGEQRFENHTDKLTNYIRFWQASGESIKLSTRIKSRMEQLTEDGYYTGGVPPFGYRLVKSGRKNKRGYEVSDIVIDEEEAEYVREIFNMTIRDGYGSFRLATYLNNKGIHTHNGSRFKSITVNRILNTRLYCGYIHCGKAESQKMPELAIIEESIFNTAQSILKQRNVKNREKSQIALQTKGATMLSGNLYCAHCGGRMISHRQHDDYIRKDGTRRVVDKMKYMCYHKMRKLNDCDGQSSYDAERIDKIVIEFMNRIFKNVKGAPKEEQVKKAFQKKLMSLDSARQRLEKSIKTGTDKIGVLQKEIANCLSGDSAFSQEDLVSAINAAKTELQESEKHLVEIKEQKREQERLIRNIVPSYNQFRTWADEFGSATMAQKRMIVGQLFSRVEIGKGYDVKIQMDVTYQDFCENWNPDNDVFVE